MHQLRRQNEGTNNRIWGLSSDGRQYVFMEIDEKQGIHESVIFGCCNSDHVVYIFSWIVTILLAGVQSLGEAITRQNEVGQFNGQVAVKVCGDEDYELSDGEGPVEAP